MLLCTVYEWQQRTKRIEYTRWYRGLKLSRASIDRQMSTEHFIELPFRAGSESSADIAVALGMVMAGSHETPPLFQKRSRGTKSRIACRMRHAFQVLIQKLIIKDKDYAWCL
jgi:hypothetical protein